MHIFPYHSGANFMSNYKNEQMLKSRAPHGNNNNNKTGRYFSICIMLYVCAKCIKFDRYNIKT